VIDLGKARREFGQLIHVELAGCELVFRPLTPSEAHRTVAQVSAHSADALDLCLETCRAACLSPPEDFERLSNLYPLAFSHDDGVIGELIRLASGAALLRVKEGSSRWKKAERNPGRMAEHLLAFKAYQGGEYDAATFAGALTIADWMQSTKGIFNMFSALLKALARRKG
jgi:hypothetical protein